MPTHRPTIPITFAVVATLLGSCRTRLWDLPTRETVCDEGASPWPMYAHDPQHRSRSCQPGPQTAHVKWRSSAYTFTGSPVIGADGTIYVGARTPDDDSIAAFSNDDGVERRRWSIARADSAPSLGLGLDGTLYEVGYRSAVANGPVHALDPNGNGERWNFPCFWERDPLVVANDGTLYVTCRGKSDAGAYALGPSGQVKWKQTFFQVGGIGLDGAVFGLFDRGTAKGSIDSVEASAGKETWSAVLNVGSPHFGLIGESGSFDLIAGTGTDAFLDSHDATDGHLLWHAPLDQDPVSTPALGIGGEYYIADGKHIIARSAAGVFIWAYAPEVSDDQFEIPVVAGDGTLYVLGWRKATHEALIVFAFTEHGVSKWQTELDEDVDQRPEGLALGRGGVLYVVGTSRLYALEN